MVTRLEATHQELDDSPCPDNRRLEQLLLAGMSLTAEATTDGVLARVLEISNEVTGVAYVAIGVLAADGHSLAAFRCRGSDPALCQETSQQSDRLLLELIAQGEPLNTWSETFDRLHPERVPDRSWIGVQIRGHRGPLGALYLSGKSQGSAFDSADLQLTRLLAAMTAAALENAWVHEERAAFLAEVHQLHRNRERFFAMVNHELRNALAAVLGWSELLVRKRDPQCIPLEAWEVLDAAEHATGLINDLLDLARLDEDRLSPVIRQVQPRALAQRAAGRVLPAAQARGIELQMLLPDRAPVIATDSSRVEQILVNLLSNAVKYTPENSRITLSLSSGGDQVVYQVEDQGCGIAGDQVERIFDIYMTRNDGQIQGIGLGLPLSRRLARLLGGELFAIPCEGRGIFVLELPLLRAESL